jgi:hypothetical protein
MGRFKTCGIVNEKKNGGKRHLGDLGVDGRMILNGSQIEYYV